MRLLSTCFVLPLLALTVVGCQQQQSSGPSAGQASVGPRSVPNDYQVLKKGNRAFTYAVSPGGTIVVYDVTANRLLLRTQIPPQTLVTVDPVAGISTGMTVLYKGPLAENNIRELRLEK